MRSESSCKPKALNTSLSYEILKIARFNNHKSTPIMNVLINQKLTHETLVDLWHFEFETSFRIWPFPARKTPIPAKSQNRQNGFLSCCFTLSPIHSSPCDLADNSFCSLPIPDSHCAYASRRRDIVAAAADYKSPASLRIARKASPLTRRLQRPCSAWIYTASA